MSSIQEQRIKNWNVEEKINFTFQKKTFFFVIFQLTHLE